MGRRGSVWRRRKPDAPIRVEMGGVIDAQGRELSRRLDALRGDEAAREEFRSLRAAVRPILVLEAYVRTRGVYDTVVAREIVAGVWRECGGLPDTVESYRTILRLVTERADAHAAMTGGRR